MAINMIHMSDHRSVSRMSARSKKVKVFLRTRPTSNFAHDMIDLQPDGKTINVHCQRDSRRGVVNNQVLDWSFKLDGILHNSSQDVVYDQVTANIVTKALDGFNGTVMAYGQTGAGKTFTMTGATENYKHRGLIPRAIAQLFKDIEDRPDTAVSVRISYLEIYNETIIDLLTTLPETMSAAQASPMTVLEDANGCYVKGLSCHLAQSEEDALNLLFEGETNRAIAAHSLNKMSSRSHVILTAYIESRSRVASNAQYTVSKLNFVDLAGSERLSKTQSVGKTKEEAMYINKSLSFLEQTVIALADKRREHVPYRQTKLTHCLKDSIGGSCNTLLVANIWGEASQIEETISTLRFATRMMCVASEPTINQHYDPTIMVQKMQLEIAALKRELAMHDTLTNRSQITYDPLSEQQRYEIRNQVRNYVEGNQDEIDIVNIRQIQGVHEAFKQLYTEMELEIEDRLRAKFTLIEKADPAAVAAAQAAGLPIGDDGELVGESDRSSFGVGPAQTGSTADKSSVISSKKREARRGKSNQRTVSPQGQKPQSPAAQSGKMTDMSMAHTPSGDKDDKRDGAMTPNSIADESKKLPPAKPSTPPPRLEAFEDFKRDLGSEIHRILTENKEIWQAKKKAYASLADNINRTKIEIDNSKLQLDSLQSERESAGPMYNEEGDIIISEEEYVEIRRLKDLKATYRTDYEQLRQLKSEVQYCQKLVDQCRQKLIQEFDKWYSESFLMSADGELQTNTEANYGSQANDMTTKSQNPLEDEQEKFDRLQMELLMENPDSAAYYNAKMRTSRRKTYEAAMSQAQPRRQFGTPTRMLRSQPPNMLQVQN